MAGTDWTDTFLDDMRGVGDPPADAVVEAIFAGGEVDAVNRLMQTLVRNDGVPTAVLPPVVQGYLETTGQLPPWADPAKVAAGEALFELHGPYCVMALACASLPSCYAARRGVQVLHLTARLQTDPVRRIGETAQLVLDVMASGGLAPDGGGVRDAQKVRLMHAAVRHLVLASGAYDLEWGTPVNQEDLAGTLLTFSVVVLDALAKLGLTISPADAEAYLHCWNCVGHILGLDPRLMADTVADGRTLWGRIVARNWEPSPEGTEMAQALIDAMEQATPGTIFHGFPNHMIRFPAGDRLGDVLELPKREWAAVFGGPLRHLIRDAEAVDEENPLVAKLAGHFSRQLLEGFSWVARGGDRAPFDIPEELAARWNVRAAAHVAASSPRST